jgi:hypothetical protein
VADVPDPIVEGSVDQRLGRIVARLEPDGRIPGVDEVEGQVPIDFEVDR